jgi:hypothetical protein
MNDSGLQTPFQAGPCHAAGALLIIRAYYFNSFKIKT